jgi:hypothetical protein
MGLARALAGARIGAGPLAAHRQAATMAQSAVAAEIHQPLDIHADFTSQVAFDHDFADFSAKVSISGSDRSRILVDGRDPRSLANLAARVLDQSVNMRLKPTQTCFWIGRFTPAMRAIRRLTPVSLVPRM